MSTASSTKVAIEVAGGGVRVPTEGMLQTVECGGHVWQGISQGLSSVSCSGPIGKHIIHEFAQHIFHQPVRILGLFLTPRGEVVCN